MAGNYQADVNRVVQMTLPTNYEQQIKNIQSSPKFQNQKPVDFPGYTIITPPYGDDHSNSDFYEYLGQFQAQLIEAVGADLLIPVPKKSFHVTFADLIWDNLYEDALAKNPDFDNLLIQEIDSIFKDYKTVDNSALPFDFEVLGLSIFPRALAVCLSPTENCYQRILKLRQLIYQDEQIIDLGIEQHYEFAAHITLGYFGKVADDTEKLQEIITKFNFQWLENAPPKLSLNRFELRRFNNMTNYLRENNWAVFEA